MKDPIERRDAIDAVLKLTYADGAYGYADAKDLVDSLENLPPAQPERKKGKWVIYDGDWLKTMFKCSECGAMIDINEKDRNFFCYHCGADMRGEQDDESRSNSNAQTDTRARGMGATDKSNGI